ncbi:small conductance mechanosensitive channel [Nocardioides albertanoniae]|uniref:Small conductance mechanosensitive channel n=1 Tax=Nocardioides albertanoniae TaxID=1175486 RepID=A0A543ABR0_9ACTN|nr:mechanosensitive ion channel family protein [Nocardioides albertanoniae]TQL70034.1 small conductance mechanosensitive channel [Nocardioides albertanoniae]
MSIPSNPPLLSVSWAKLGEWVIGIPLRIVGLIVLAFVLRWILHRVIDKVVVRAVDSPGLAGRAHKAADAGDAIAASSRRSQRAKAIGSLLKSVVTGVLVAIFATMILDQLGINIAPIIASAGIVGLALGFGAQSLVRDYLSGMFMIIEDQYGVGDSIEVNNISGTVEAVTLRITRLRALDGTVWYIPNGEILTVGNHSQNWARAVIDVGVSYNEDLSKVQRVLREVSHDLWVDDEFKGQIIEEPEVTGVEALAAESITLRVLIKTLPLKQWAIAREMRQRIKARLDHEGIEMPFPQRIIWHRDDKVAAAAEQQANA